ncbi:hypothetical protein CANCADRAFT_30683 [Tortispora caseinolytica NRRL Y-17796]|uniref:Iron-sulfur clusters transporter ATM1, mitochondrial n=1 Tax=Tortispora caseinolytica NRRL Y-17796 TaxID=767744 RepID=A0A1E4TLB2_9ASCO|nr:hypothetical protein CANCADRAFT_30683 [Tortispora caseinolytica NRRL Y-17796]
MIRAALRRSVPRLACSIGRSPILGNQLSLHLRCPGLARTFSVSQILVRDKIQEAKDAKKKAQATDPYSNASRSDKQATLATLPEKEVNQANIIKGFIKYIWPKKGGYGIKARVIIALSLLVLSKVLNVQVPSYFKAIIDGMNIDFSDGMHTVWTVIGATIMGYGLTRVGATLFGEMRNAVFASVAQRAIRQVALSVYTHLLQLDLGFHLSRQTGGLSRAIDRGTKGISFVLSSMVFHILPISLEIGLVSCILSYNYGPVFAGITLVTMGAYAYFTIRTTAWRTQFRRRANAADQKAATVSVDSLINYEAVKYFNNEAYEVSRYDKALSDYEKASIKVATSLALLNSGQNIIFSTALTAMMYLGAQDVATSSLTIGDLVMINQLVFQLSVPLNFLGSVYREFKQSMIDMETMFRLQKVNLTVVDKPDAPRLDLKGGEIRFENVTFGYHPDRMILKNASFTVPAGKKVAIVGPSGSGKSTIFKLAFRFYDVGSGRVLIDGQGVQDVSLDSLRSAIGVVPQDTPLFNNTIMHNIRYGRITASDDEVIEAAKRAHIHESIMKFPDGYNTMVGERGMMISGGEKQRLAVSRLILKDTPISFYDEATSALDTETERSLLQNINDIIRDKGVTSVFIAHRLRTVMDSDRIIVLKDGSVAEEGSHDELLARNGIYAKMWHAQEDLGMIEEGQDPDFEDESKKI